MVDELRDTRKRWSPPRWLLLLWLPLVAVVIGFLAVDVTGRQETAADHRRAADLLAHVEAIAYRERVATTRAIAGLTTSEAARTQVRQAAAAMAADVDALQGLDGDGDEGRIGVLVDIYQRAVQRELALLESGRTLAARELDARTVEPRLEELVRSAELLRPIERAAADDLQAAARRAMAAIVLVGLLGVVAPLLIYGVARQRTRRALAHAKRIEQSEHRFRALVQNASDAIVVLDANLDIRAVHGAQGAVAGGLVGKSLSHIVHPDDRLLARALCENAAGAGPETTEWRIAHPDGSWGHCEVAIADLTADPAVRGLVLTLRDVSRRKELEEQLRHRAFHDPLTQLPNRALFLDRAEHALARERREGGAVAVLYVDLDHFKVVNDSLGHAVGDDLLIEVAQRLRSCVRSVDTAARLGGDEFGVLLEDVVSASEAVQAAERVLGTMGEPFAVAGGEHSLRASIGVVVSDGSGEGADELMRRADVAMYAAKAHGEGRYELFDSALEHAFDGNGETDAGFGDRITFFVRGEEQRAEVASLLAKGDAPQMVVQPMIDLRTGLIAGYEALARFPGSERPPNAWFSQAHRHGLGTVLEARAVERALALPGRPDRVFLSMNLSPSALVSEEVWAVLPEDLSGVVVEVTENELASRRESLDAGIERLRSRGARLAVDDAGAGYAGLKQLMYLDPDVIKLDRTLVTDVSRHPTKAALIESFARYGQRTGAQICAEGVEALDDLRTLAELDVTYAQGYVIARPGAGWPDVSADAQATCAAADPGLRTETGAGPESDERILERIVAELSGVRTRPALHGCLKRVAANLNADELHITMLDPSGTFLDAVSGLGSALEGTRWLLADYPDTEHVLRAQETRQVMTRDPHADPAEVELLRVQGIASMLMVPILYGGLTVGLLEAYATEERPWSRGQIYRARIIAYQLGAVLQRLGASTDVPAQIPARSVPLDEIVRRRRLAGP
jgi:diguanylate cyclase (GGDEF)-like protein/PAS domain S-box-containing protein